MAQNSDYGVGVHGVFNDGKTFLSASVWMQESIEMAFLVSVVSQTITAQAAKARCPAGTLNEGWIVEKGHAFSDPLDCCHDRVSDWQA